MATRPIRGVFATAAALALVVGACTNGDGTEASTTSDSPAATGPRSSSFRGVTEDTIRIGALGIDFDTLRELGLVDIDFGDGEQVFQAFADDLNARGGILGRHVEMHYRSYDVLSIESALAACVELTEDVGVFAVINGFNGPAQTADDCIANQHETILFSEAATNEEMIAGRAPWIQVGFPGNARLDRALIDLAEAEGLLDDEVVAVHSLVASADRVPAVVDRLDSLGVEVAFESVNDAPGGDAVAGAQQWSIIAERIRSAGVTTLIILGPAAFELGQMIDNDLDLQVLNADNAVAGIGGYDAHAPSDYDGVVGTVGQLPDESWEAPEYVQCAETFESASGIEVVPAEQVPAGEPVWIVSITQACNRFALFEQLATLAGANLTNESFRAAIDAGPDITLPAVPFVSFGPQKYDGNDTLRLGVFDPSIPPEGNMRPLTELTQLE
jgi:hypothetical protein